MQYGELQAQALVKQTFLIFAHQSKTNIFYKKWLIAKFWILTMTKHDANQKYYSIMLLFWCIVGVSTMLWKHDPPVHISRIYYHSIVPGTLVPGTRHRDSTVKQCGTSLFTSDSIKCTSLCIQSTFASKNSLLLPSTILASFQKSVYILISLFSLNLLQFPTFWLE